MPDGTTPTASSVSQLLDQIEDRLNCAEIGDALGLLAQAKQLAALGPCSDCGSTDEGHATPCGWKKPALWTYDPARDGEKPAIELVQLQLENAILRREFGKAALLAQKAKDEAATLINNTAERVEQEDEDEDVSVDDVLVADISDDSVHRAMCMSYALAEWQSQHVDEATPDEDVLYGRWLLNSAVTQLLRVAKQQMTAEYRRERRHAFTPAECAVLAKGVSKLLSNCKNDEEFAIAQALERTLAADAAGGVA